MIPVDDANSYEKSKKLPLQSVRIARRELCYFVLNIIG